MNPTLPPDHAARLERALLALDGLSVGDALGETCFRIENRAALLRDPTATAAAPWPWTDDTAMAIEILAVLRDFGRIEQDTLAQRLAARYAAEPFRGYGSGAHRLLRQIGTGIEWRYAAQTVFPGGSFGNGSAMRVAPLAGYFAADDLAVVAEQARLSAEVTHAHPEGIAGAVAVAVAGAYAWRCRDRCGDREVKQGLFDVVLAYTPPGEVRDGIVRATTIPFELLDAASGQPLRQTAMRATDATDAAIDSVVRQLGNGAQISCQDTVPFCLWSAARHLDDYPAAIVNTVRAGGDIDTNCAIVGGIVALAVGRAAIPADWLRDREALPT